jgi:hypothetical protein
MVFSASQQHFMDRTEENTLTNTRLRRLPPIALLTVPVLLTACAGVKVASVGPQDYIAARRADILATGQLSAAAGTALHVVGWDARTCATAFDACRGALAASPGLAQELRQSALAEVWLQESLRIEARAGPGSTHQAVIAAYLEAARHAYAYLFWSERRPGQRALEERQGQVRDYYNFAVQQAVRALFSALKQQRGATPPAGSYPAGRWRITVRADQGIAGNRALPDDLVPAPTLTF